MNIRTTYAGSDSAHGLAESVRLINAHTGHSGEGRANDVQLKAEDDGEDKRLEQWRREGRIEKREWEKENAELTYIITNSG